jgi:hypothetical protein
MDFDDPEMARAVSEARAALVARMAPSQVVTRAGTMLRMVRQGFRDMQETDDEDRILLGFLGVVVFGRSMTLVMQNMRRFDQEAFDTWYAPCQEEMKGDPLMRYFYDLRTRVIHHDAPAIGILLAAHGGRVPPFGSITVDGLPLPELHLGQPLDDNSMGNLCRLYLAYLQRMFESFSTVGFAVQDRLIVAEGG